MTIFNFIPIRFVDLLDIAIIAFLLYQLYALMRDTIAVHIFFGLIGLYLIDVIVTAADMTMLRTLFSTVSDVFVLALIILFQPEIRRVLLMLGASPLIRRFMNEPEQNKMIEEVVAAVAEMSKNRMGALMAFQRTTGLRTYVETGTEINSQVNRDLLQAIFFPKSPLHDGAAIIINQRVAAARCILPVSHSMKLSPYLGLRHRAAVGITEQTDAYVVIVSEETGNISIADDGELVFNLTVSELRTRLVNAFSIEAATEKELAVATP